MEKARSFALCRGSVMSRHVETHFSGPKTPAQILREQAPASNFGASRIADRRNQTDGQEWLLAMCLPFLAISEPRDVAMTRHQGPSSPARLKSHIRLLRMPTEPKQITKSARGHAEVSACPHCTGFSESAGPHPDNPTLHGTKPGIQRDLASLSRALKRSVAGLACLARPPACEATGGWKPFQIPRNECHLCHLGSTFLFCVNVRIVKLLKSCLDRGLRLPVRLSRTHPCRQGTPAASCRARGARCCQAA